MSDDLELVERIRKGAVDEFEQLIRRHQSMVFAILHRYERDAHKIEDLAQETFLKAWRFLERYDGRSPFQHWLSRIAVNTALDHLRRAKRHRPELALEDLGEDALDWLNEPGEASRESSRQASVLLEEGMKCLLPEDRVLLTLLEIEGRSVKEISSLLGVSGVAVRVRAFRARAKLKRELEEILEKQNERQ